MWESYKADDRAMHSFLALGLKPQFPLSRVEKIKAKITGFFYSAFGCSHRP